MDVKELREAAGMTRKEFSEYFDIKYRTIQKWETGERECFEPLLKLMEYKLQNEGKIK